MSFTTFHIITTNYFVVDVEVCFQEKDGMKFFGSVIPFSFEELHVDAFFPSAIGKTRFVGKGTLMGIESSEAIAFGVRLVHSKRETARSS